MVLLYSLMLNTRISSNVKEGEYWSGMGLPCYFYSFWHINVRSDCFWHQSTKLLSSTDMGSNIHTYTAYFSSDVSQFIHIALQLKREKTEIEKREREFMSYFNAFFFVIFTCSHSIRERANWTSQVVHPFK